MRGSLLQGNGVDKMGLGVSKSWGKVPAACAGRSARGRIAGCNLGCPHCLLFLSIRQRGPTNGSSGFLHFGPKNHLTWWFSPFFLTSWFCDHRRFLFSFAHPSFKLKEVVTEEAFLPSICSVWETPFAAWIPIQAPHLWHVEIFTFLVTQRFKTP